MIKTVLLIVYALCVAGVAMLIASCLAHVVFGTIAELFVRSNRQLAGQIVTGLAVLAGVPVGTQTFVRVMKHPVKPQPPAQNLSTDDEKEEIE